MLKSQLNRVGTKFKVTKDTIDTILGPGTTGYFSYVKGNDRDYSNVAYIVCSIIRRGKGGKDRVETTTISTPIFETNIDISKHMPDERRKQYVHIELIENKCSNVLKMTDIEFIGWALAYCHYIKKLNTLSKRINVWPSNPNHIINKILYASEYFNEDMKEAKIELCNDQVRIAFVEEIRKLEAMLVKCTLPYSIKIGKLQINALETLAILGNKDIKNKIVKISNAINHKIKNLKKCFNAKQMYNEKNDLEG